MVSLFLLLGCNLSYIVDLFAGLHELASASAHITNAHIIGVRAAKTLWRHLKEHWKQTMDKLFWIYFLKHLTFRTSPDPGLSTSAITLYVICAFHLSPLAWFPSASKDPDSNRIDDKYMYFAFQESVSFPAVCCLLLIKVTVFKPKAF